VKIFLATGNINKIEEISKILENMDIKNIEILSVKDNISIPHILEDGKTFEENSIKKAVEIANFLNIPTIADDSGLSVEALNGAPGVYSARYAGEYANDSDNNKKLVKELSGILNRNAKFICVITLGNPDGSYHSFRGEVSGEIIDDPRGINGFGYDPYFYLKEFGKTMAEIAPDEKNAISHRSKALEQLKRNIYKIFEKN
jgi:XTP/dITP diphosphohydrolase